jgi:hypothetical protein
LSFLPFQLTSSLLCLHTFIVKTVLVCFFPFPAFCLLCHEAAVQAPFSPLITTASYCVFLTRTTEMVALREMYHFISLRLSYLALNTATFQVRCLTWMFQRNLDLYTAQLSRCLYLFLKNQQAIQTQF